MKKTFVFDLFVVACDVFSKQLFCITQERRLLMFFIGYSAAAVCRVSLSLLYLLLLGSVSMATYFFFSTVRIATLANFLRF